MNVHLCTNRDGSQVWRLEVHVKDGDQSRRRVATIDATNSGDKGRAKAEAAWEKLKRDTLRQLREGVDPDKQHLANYLQAWLEPDKTRNLRPKTRADYRYTLTHYVVPELGHTPLAQLKRQSVQGVWDRLASEGRVRTAHKARTILRKALEDARRDGRVESNVVDLTSVPPGASRRRERGVFNVHQVDILIAAARQISASAPDWQAKTIAPLLTVAAFSGLRLGEICGLQWEDWDERAHALLIRRSIVLEGGKPVIQEETKTPDSNRVHTLLDDAQVGLEEQWRIVQDLRAATGIVAFGGAWVFPNLVTHQHLHPRTIARMYERARDRAGLPKYGFHSLRHFYTSVLGNADVPMEVAAKRLGHRTSRVTTEIYSHLLSEGDRDAARKASAWLARHRTGDAPEALNGAPLRCRER